MANISQFLAAALINHACCKTVYNASAFTASAFHLGWYTVAPTSSTAGTEVTTGQVTGYGRTSIAAGVLTAAGLGSNLINNTQIGCSTSAGGSTCTVVAWAISDDPTAGHQLWFGTLGSSFVWGNGVQPILPVTTGLSIGLT